MCVIIHKPYNVTLADKTLIHAWATNKDGAGVLLPHKTRPELIKGLMTLNDLRYALKGVGKREATIHLRFATHGAVNADNTHPFPLGDRRYLFHNGTLSGHGSSGVSSNSMSDSAQLAHDLRPLGNAAIRRILDSLPGKYIFVDRNVISSHGQFEKLEGAYFSNSYFLPIKTSYNKKTGITAPTRSGHLWPSDWDESDLDFDYIDGKTADTEQKINAAINAMDLATSERSERVTLGTANNEEKYLEAVSDYDPYSYEHVLTDSVKLTPADLATLNKK